MKRNWFVLCAVLATLLSLAAGPAWSGKPADLPANNQIECPEGADGPAHGKLSIEVDLFSGRVTVKVESSAAKAEMPPNIDAMLPIYIDQALKFLGESIATVCRQEAAAAERARKTRTVETQLFEQVNVRIKDVPLQQAIKNLAYASGVPMALDFKSMKDARINLDAPVSLAAENTSVHVALCQLLHEAGLTYELQDGTVIVTTQCRGSKSRRGSQTREELLEAAKDKQAQRMFEIGERCRRAGDYEKARTCYQQVHFLAPTTLHGRVAIVRLVEIEERMRDATEEQSPIPGRCGDPDEEYRDMLNSTVPLGLVELSV